jgi:hypothetical protein
MVRIICKRQLDTWGESYDFGCELDEQMLIIVLKFLFRFMQYYGLDILVLLIALILAVISILSYILFIRQSTRNIEKKDSLKEKIQ